MQANSNWQDLGGAEKHYARFPREFRRLQERYEADQAAPAEEPDYQVVGPDAENQAEAQSAWGQVLEALRGQVPGPTFATYLQQTEGHSVDVSGGFLRVVCPSVQVIERRLYQSVVKQAGAGGRCPGGGVLRLPELCLAGPASRCFPLPPTHTHMEHQRRRIVHHGAEQQLGRLFDGPTSECSRWRGSTAPRTVAALVVPSCDGPAVQVGQPFVSPFDLGVGT